MQKNVYFWLQVSSDFVSVLRKKIEKFSTNEQKKVTRRQDMILLIIKCDMPKGHNAPTRHVRQFFIFILRRCFVQKNIWKKVYMLLGVSSKIVSEISKTHLNYFWPICK